MKSLGTRRMNNFPTSCSISKRDSEIWRNARPSGRRENVRNIIDPTAAGENGIERINEEWRGTVPPYIALICISSWEQSQRRVELKSSCHGSSRGRLLLQPQPRCESTCHLNHKSPRLGLFANVSSPISPSSTPQPLIQT